MIVAWSGMVGRLREGPTMLRYPMIMISLLALPSIGNAQGLPIDFDADSEQFYADAAPTQAGQGQAPADIGQLLQRPVRRSVRIGTRTLRLSDEALPAAERAAINGSAASGG